MGMGSGTGGPKGAGGAKGAGGDQRNYQGPVRATRPGRHILNEAELAPPDQTRTEVKPAATLRHLMPQMPVARRAGILMAGSVAVTGITSLAVSKWPASTALGSIMIILAAAAALAGLYFLMVVCPERQRKLDRVTLIGRVRVLASPSRDQTFTTLLAIDQGHELAPMARAIHDVLVATHRTRMEASWLRREMESEVDKQTRKRTATLERLSSTDGLTGLLNRRGFDEQFEDLFVRSQREGENLAVIAIDMDFFKTLNDVCGHAKGDEALTIAGQVLKSQLRETDLAGRMGGDELVVVLFGSESTDARQVAERIAHLFSTHPSGHNLPCDWPSLSAGIAARIEHSAETSRDLLAKADRALYDSKKSGRRRATIFGEDWPTSRVA